MDIKKIAKPFMRLQIKIIDYQLNRRYRTTMTNDFGTDGVEFIHALFQELEDQNINLPMGDYTMIYDILEGIREELNERRD